MGNSRERLSFRSAKHMFIVAMIGLGGCSAPKLSEPVLRPCVRAEGSDIKVMEGDQVYAGILEWQVPDHCSTLDGQPVVGSDTSTQASDVTAESTFQPAGRDFRTEAITNLRRFVSDSGCGQTGVADLAADNNTAVEAKVIEGLMPGAVKIVKDKDGNPFVVRVNCSIAQAHLAQELVVTTTVVPYEDIPDIQPFPASGR